MLALPDWPTAPGYPLLYQVKIVKQYDTGSGIFTCPASATYSADNLHPAGHLGGLDNVFVQGRKWPVIVITTTKLTGARINQAKLLHARLGHIAPITMNAVIRSSIQTCIGTTIHNVGTQIPSDPCSLCAQAELKRHSFHPQCQSCMEDHIAPFSFVC